METQAPFEAEAAQFRLRAAWHRQIPQTDDAEIIRELMKLIDEFEMLAQALEAVGMVRA